MARPSPHPVTTAALTSASPSHLAFILPPLVDRERRRHRDAALVRQRIRVGPESEVHTETPEPQPPTPAELHALALVARDAAAEHENADALLPADVHRSAATAVEHVSPERRLAHGIRQVDQIRDRQLGFRLDVVRDRLAEARVTVERAVDPCVGPGNRGRDVVHPDAVNGTGSFGIDSITPNEATT